MRQGCVKGLDHCPVWIVNQQLDMGEFQQSIFADGLARRNAVENRTFRRPGQFPVAWCEIISLQIDGNQPTFAARMQASLPVNDHAARRQGNQDTLVEILRHGLVDAGDSAFDWRVSGMFQINFR